MKTRYKIILIAFCILVVVYTSIITIGLGPDEILNPASIPYFPGVIIQLVSNEGNGIICVDACGPCSAWGPWHVLVDGECILPDRVSHESIFEVEVKTEPIFANSPSTAIFEIKSSITGGTVVDMVKIEENNSLLITIIPRSIGLITISIPPGLIDPIPKNANDQIIILVDDEEIPYEMTIDRTYAKTVSIPFSSNTQTIEIINTYFR